ncbi:hypothetical protein AD03_2290 [Escherichia coli 2-474-04_S4_C2]|nr:hypothetical protein AD03_2290 [Escherichia coli 2-474-04_S4_C2]
MRNRFIPAGAGNTYSATFRALRAAVYPRWRGEHGPVNFRHEQRYGLSPLARGTPPAQYPLLPSRRFIPAGAGDTVGKPLGPVLTTVYPRWRGEHTKHTYLFLNKFIPHQQSTN